MIDVYLRYAVDEIVGGHKWSGYDVMNVKSDGFSRMGRMTTVLTNRGGADDSCFRGCCVLL